MKSNQNIEKSLNQLIHALAQDSNQNIYKIYKELYAIGNDVIPFIKDYLLSHDWSLIEYNQHTKILCGLISLMNDIDEINCKQTVEIIISKKCPKAIEKCLKSMIAFSLGDYHSYSLHDIKIYESKFFKQDKTIKRKLDKWLSIVPKNDIIDLDRIYIVEDNENYTFAGKYMPILDFITIVWYTNNKSFLTKWIDLLNNERTLYHEIGHYVNKHTFGQDLKQEKEADEYANIFMQENHKFLKIFAKLLITVGVAKKK